MRVLAGAAYAHPGRGFYSDWILALLSVWLLWNVQISRSKKIGIGFMLGLGLLCCVAAICVTVACKIGFPSMRVKTSALPQPYRIRQRSPQALF